MAEKMLFQSGKRTKSGLLSLAGDILLIIILLAIDAYLIMQFVTFFEMNEMITTFGYTLMLPVLILAHLGIYFTFLSRRNNFFTISQKTLLFGRHDGQEEKIGISLLKGITMMNALRHSCFVIFEFEKRKAVFLIDSSEKGEFEKSVLKAGLNETEGLWFLGQKSFKFDIHELI